ncbi:hypothetical protein [Nesterenkonia sp. HG001]|uniref:hypothetical protein n=1 Tax=Nesterenkonia sp. HG001 TaxID=2983207 RepID=UPI002AC76D2D|nr:hypothetical protein [Nesterenkonia sp. HG001]MDZ5077002.1 hypothetical protein [Nesterenkonia sp. HG001]
MTSRQRTAEMPSALRDGFEVHTAALARRMSVTLLPRQVLIVGGDGRPAGETAFAHGIPQTTTLSGATFAQDKRIRRAILAKAGFKVPKGATFSVGRSRGAARRYAERIGYPVVLKPAQGDNTIETQADIRDEEALVRGAEYFFAPPGDRADYVRAAYALTELREPGIHNGQIVVPPGYRFLIEEQVRGAYVRLLVLEGQIVNAMYLPHGPWNSGDQGKDITDEVHESLKTVARDVVTAFQGLSLAAVDVVVPDWRTEVTRQEVPIVELSERPWLAVQGAVSSDTAEELAVAILESGVARTLPTPTDTGIHVQTRLEGAVNAQGFLDAMIGAADTLDLEAMGQVADTALGTVTMTLRGGAHDVAALIEQALDSGVGGQRAMLAETAEVSPERG